MKIALTVEVDGGLRGLATAATMHAHLIPSYPTGRDGPSRTPAGPAPQFCKAIGNESFGGEARIGPRGQAEHSVKRQFHLLSAGAAEAKTNARAAKKPHITTNGTDKILAARGFIA